MHMGHDLLASLPATEHSMQWHNTGSPFTVADPGKSLLHVCVVENESIVQGKPCKENAGTNDQGKL